MTRENDLATKTGRFYLQGNEIAGRNACNTSKSACFSTSSALILFKMNSASFATLTM